MILKIQYILCLVAALCCMSCKYSFIVKKSNVIKKEKGFLLLEGYNHSTYNDIFIKNEFCSSKDIITCFQSIKEYKAFRVYTEGVEYRKKLIENYASRFNNSTGDTLNKVYILPVEIEYTINDIKEMKRGNPYFSDSPFQLIVNINERKTIINYYVDRIRTVAIIPLSQWPKNSVKPTK